VELTTIEDRRRKWTPMWKANVRDITSGKKPVSPAVSEESASRAIAALAGFGEWRDVVNIPNQGQVAGLRQDAVVETMGLITRDRVYGLPVGRVPSAVLTQIERHVTNQEMIVEAAVTGDRSLVLQAMLNDPLCGSIRRYTDMERMLDELLAANRRWLPRFASRRPSRRRL
jgi:alpha-galactosidase